MMDELVQQQFFLQVLQFFPANHLPTIALYSSVTVSKYTVA
jgi:hypothetical protein